MSKQCATECGRMCDVTHRNERSGKGLGVGATARVRLARGGHAPGPPEDALTIPNSGMPHIRLDRFRRDVVG